jgi:hypothetical protein
VLWVIESQGSGGQSHEGCGGGHSAGGGYSGGAQSHVVIQSCAMFSFLSQEMNVEDLKDEPPTPDGCPDVSFRVHANDFGKNCKLTKLFETTAQLRQLIKIFSISRKA